MKILQVISNPAIGGTETFIIALTPQLEKAGCTVDTVNIWQDSQLKPVALSSNLSYAELNSTSRHISLVEAAKIIRLIRQKNYDLVIGYGIRVSILLRATRPWTRNTPVIVGLRGLDGWRKWYHVWIDRLTEFACDMFVPNSNAVAECRMRRERTPRHKIVVIKNGIDIEYFDKHKSLGAERKQFGLPEDKLIVTTVGNLRYQKGHDFLLDVIEAFSTEFEDVHFVWVGGGGGKEALEQRIKSIGVTEKITMLEYIKNVRSLLACSDIFVLPSREEGMPRSLMEAMAMVLPCVATNVGGTAEVLEDEISGFLSEFGDVEKFGNNIKQLIDHADLRLKVGTAARKRVVTHFSIDVIAKKYIKLFQLVMAGERNGKKIQHALDN